MNLTLLFDGLCLELPLPRQGFPVTLHGIDFRRTRGRDALTTPALHAVWRELLQDPGLMFGIPEVGFRTKRANSWERTQVGPAIKVLNDAKSTGEGQDPQIEKLLGS